MPDADRYDVLPGPLRGQLDGLAADHRDRDLRRFAAAVARIVVPLAPPSGVDLTDAAERAASGDPIDLGALRDRSSGTASAAATIGLKHGARNAPAFLVCFAACTPDAHRAALETARLATVYGRDLDLSESDLAALIP